jgi:hypothetical protein
MEGVFRELMDESTDCTRDEWIAAQGELAIGLQCASTLKKYFGATLMDGLEARKQEVAVHILKLEEDAEALRARCRQVRIFPECSYVRSAFPECSLSVP